MSAELNRTILRSKDDSDVNNNTNDRIPTISANPKDENVNSIIKKISNNTDKLKINVIMDYKDFSGENIDESQLFKKYSEKEIFNLNINGNPFGGNVTKIQLAKILNTIPDKNKGGSKKTKRSSKKHKKQKTEKKKN